MQLAVNMRACCLPLCAHSCRIASLFQRVQAGWCVVFVVHVMHISERLNLANKCAVRAHSGGTLMLVICAASQMIVSVLTSFAAHRSIVSDHPILCMDV